MLVVVSLGANGSDWCCWWCCCCHSRAIDVACHCHCCCCCFCFCLYFCLCFLPILMQRHVQGLSIRRSKTNSRTCTMHAAACRWNFRAVAFSDALCQQERERERVKPRREELHCATRMWGSGWLGEASLQVGFNDTTDNAYSLHYSLTAICWSIRMAIMGDSIKSKHVYSSRIFEEKKYKNSFEL